MIRLGAVAERRTQSEFAMQIRMLVQERASRRQWIMTAVVALACVGTGSFGLWKYENEAKSPRRHHVGYVYHAAQALFVNTSYFNDAGGPNGWMIVSRWLGFAAATSAAIATFWSRVHAAYQRTVVRGASGHTIICGLGEKGFAVAETLKRKPRDGARTRGTDLTLFVDPKPSQELIDRCHEEGFLIMLGDATDPRVLRAARVEEAKEIIVATAEDGTNLRIAAELSAIRAARGRAMATSHVHVSDIHLRDTLQRWSSMHPRPSVRETLHFFDVFDCEARGVLDRLKIDCVTTNAGAAGVLDASKMGIRTGDERTVQIVMLGFGRMARSLAIRAVKLGHFANGRLLKLVVVDRFAGRQRGRFEFRYPALAPDFDLGGRRICDLKFIEAEVESLATKLVLDEALSAPDQATHVFVCLDDDARGLEIALRLQSEYGPRLASAIHVRVRSRRHSNALLELKTADGVALNTFGAIEDACTDEAFRKDAHDDLPRLVHEIYVEERRTKGLGDSEALDGDPAVRPWSQLDEELKDSNRAQADHIPIKLRALGIDPESPPDDSMVEQKYAAALASGNLDGLARAEHARFCAERLLSGWRLGPTKDVKKRLSPYLRPWDELGDKIRALDMIPLDKLKRWVGFFRDRRPKRNDG